MAHCPKGPVGNKEPKGEIYQSATLNKFSVAYMSDQWGKVLYDSYAVHCSWLMKLQNLKIDSDLA